MKGILIFGAAAAALMSITMTPAKACYSAQVGWGAFNDCSSSLSSVNAHVGRAAIARTADQARRGKLFDTNITLNSIGSSVTNNIEGDGNVIRNDSKSAGNQSVSSQVSDGNGGDIFNFPKPN